MRLQPLLARQSQSCITCPNPPPCACKANQDCFQINRDCLNCGSFRCVDKPGSPSGSKGSGGSNVGALAGAVVGSMILVSVVAVWYWVYRRRAIAARKMARSSAKDVPAPAETVLNRPDPTEKPPTPSPQDANNVRLYTNSTDGTTDLDPQPSRRVSAARSATSNPFSDKDSIQTAGTEGTNVIPIALVPASSVTSESTVSHSDGPLRPLRSPELNLNLDHVNVSRDTLRPYAQSQLSGVSSRQSYMSNASDSSDFLNEAPMIVSSQGAIRQVLGVVKAEVIHTPGSSPSSPTSNTLKVPSKSSRPGSSPLAATPLGPADIARETEQEQELDVQGNPFSDMHSPNSAHNLCSPPATTFADPSNRDTQTSFDSEWTPSNPHLPWTRSSDSRPVSMSTQAGSIADIGSATRVYVGPASGGLAPVSPYRTAMGKLISPTGSGGAPGALEEQQQLAIAHAQAQAQAQGYDRRVSGSSVVTAASMGGDSILESFPFVPPSPISNRPIRTPPVSPLANSFGIEPTKEPSTPTRPQPPQNPLPPLEPPNRKLLGLSTASESSTASTGLGSFPFQIESGQTSDARSSAAVHGQAPQRASLDTLALTNDLSSYPLGLSQDARDSFLSGKN